MPQHQIGVKLGHKERADAIGQPAFFAHFLHEARLETASAKRFVQDIGGEIVRVVAFNPGVTEQRHRLRRVIGNNGGATL